MHDAEPVAGGHVVADLDLLTEPVPDGHVVPDLDLLTEPHPAGDLLADAHADPYSHAHAYSDGRELRLCLDCHRWSV
jgi:hypothetical protein